MRLKRVIALILSAVVLVAFVALLLGIRGQRRATAQVVEQLVRDAESDRPQIDRAAMASLPPPVDRYLRWAHAARQPLPRLVRVWQRGALRTDVRSDRWMSFDAEHVAAPLAVGFVWNARVRIAPLLHVRVRDALVDGRGSGHVSLLSAFTVGSARNVPQMDSGALHRFLAEAPWYPAALLPSARLRWSPIDAGRARATLTDHGVSVSLEFRFSTTGEVTAIYTPARWGTFEGGFAQHGWEGHFRNYQLRDGVYVPSEGDVGWYVDDRLQPVWRGTITAYESRSAAQLRERGLSER